MTVTLAVVGVIYIGFCKWPVLEQRDLLSVLEACEEVMHGNERFQNKVYLLKD